jgi:hypothetical protein
MSSESFENLSYEDRTFPPSQSFVDNANVKGDIMWELDVILIGTGFCGSTIANFLEDKSLTVRVIEPSSFQTPIMFTKTVDSVFSDNQANKTSGLGGGSTVWGKAITHPNNKNWFIERGNTVWEQLCEVLGTISLSSEMNIPNPKLGNSKFVNSNLPNLKGRFYEEIGLYAGDELGEANTFSLPKFNQSYLLHATVLDLKVNANNYAVTIRDENGTTREIRCKYLVLASGTFLNACFYSLISGQKEFPLSNHFAADFGKIVLKKPITVRDGVQTYASGEKAFSTFTALDLSQDAVRRPNTSIRLQANHLLVGRKRIVLALLKFEFFYFFKTILPFMFAKFKGARLVDNLVIRVIADQDLIERNKMTVLSFRDGTFRAEITLKIEEQISLDAHRAAKEFIEIVSSSKMVRSVNLFDVHEIAWEDPAHYFGTTPIGLDSYRSSLTSNSESLLYPGLYILGNSSFPVGSHGHPTLLAMQLSMVAALHIVSTDKS